MLILLNIQLFLVPRVAHVYVRGGQSENLLRHFEPRTDWISILRSTSGVQFQIPDDLRSGQGDSDVGVNPEQFKYV